MMSQSSTKPARKWPVAVLGATGAVGQTFIRLLEGHPWFDVAEVAGPWRDVLSEFAGRPIGLVRCLSRGRAIDRSRLDTQAEPIGGMLIQSCKDMQLVLPAT